MDKAQLLENSVKLVNEFLLRCYGSNWTILG